MNEETKEDIVPWDKLPAESARAFVAFDLYRAAGPKRSLVETYRQETGRKQAVQPSGEWTRWYTLFEWKARAEAHDLHMAQMTRRKAESEHVESINNYRDRAARISITTAEIANAFLLKAGERLQGLNVDEIPIKSLPTFLRGAAAIAQVSLSMEAEALGVRELENLLGDTDQSAAEDAD